jgi:hypothetical protein
MRIIETIVFLFIVDSLVKSKDLSKVTSKTAKKEGDDAKAKVPDVPKAPDNPIDQAAHKWALPMNLSDAD